MAEEMEIEMAPLDERIAAQMIIVETLQEKGGGEDLTKAIQVLDTLYKLKLRESEINVDWNKEVLKSDNEQAKIEVEKSKLKLEEERLELDRARFKQQKRENVTNIIMSSAGIVTGIGMDVFDREFDNAMLNEIMLFEDQNYVSGSGKGIISNLVSRCVKRRR